MKKDTLLIYGLIFQTLLVIIMVIRFGNLKDKNARYESVIKEKNAIIEYHTNEHGRIVAEKQAAEISTAEFKKFYKEDTKRIREDFDIKIKNLKGFIKAGFEAKGSGVATIINNHYVDSTGRKVEARKFHFADNYLDFSSVILDSANHALSTYSYTDTLVYAFHVKKKGWFGKEQLYGSGEFGNKNAKITSATNVLIKDYKDKRWVVTVGVSYVPFGSYKIQPTVGVGYAFLKF